MVSSSGGCKFIILLLSIIEIASFAPPLSNQRVTTAITANGRVKPRKDRTDDLLNFIEKPSQLAIDPSSFPPGTPETDDLAVFVKAIVKAADMRKAEDIRAVRVSKITALTSFLVIVSGNSRPQNQAIALAIREEAEENHDRELKGPTPEGTADSGWILLDYGDVMVHIMTPRSRLFYDLEGQWKEGEDMNLQDVLVPNSVDDVDVQSEQTEEDPFWS